MRPVRILAACCLISTAAVTGTVGSGGGTAAVAAPAQGSGSDAEASLEVLDQDLEIDANDTFRVRLRIRDAPPGSDLAVDIYERIEDPAAFAASATARPSGASDTFDPIPLAVDGPTAQQDEAVALAIYGDGGDRPASVNAYELDEPGVYPVRIRLRGTDDELLTSLVTYLVRRPTGDETVSTAQVALLTTVHQAAVPTGADPTAGLTPPEDGEPDGEGAGDEPGKGEATSSTVPEPDPESTTSGAWRDALDDVLRAFAERAELPASFVVTPETADRLAADPAAADTLTALQAEVGRPGRELTAAPYVNIDPASLVANGLSSEILRQTDLGTSTLIDTLQLPDGAPRAGADTWVIENPVDDPTVDLLATLGITRLVLPSDATVAGTPQARLPIPGGDRATEALSTSPVALATDRIDDPVLAGYQLLGRLAALGSITPGGTAAVLRIDPDTVDPDQLETVLDGLATPSAFVRGTTVAGAFTEGPLAETPVTLTPANVGDLGTYPALVRETHGLLDSYESMLIDRDDLVEAYLRPLAVTATSDADLLVRRRALRRIQADLLGQFGAISTPSSDRVTLGARDAQFPLTITSTLSEPVNVLITLEASDRLTFPDDTIEATLTDERTIVQIPVQTRATGDTPLRITVRTPDGRQVLAESRYTIRSTAVSGVGLLLTIGAGTFLALWWGRHWVRTRRGRHQRPRDRGDGTDQPSPAAGDDELFVATPDDGEV